MGKIIIMFINLLCSKNVKLNKKYVSGGYSLDETATSKKYYIRFFIENISFLFWKCFEMSGNICILNLFIW